MNNKKRVNILFFTAFFILLLYPTNLFSQQADEQDVAKIMAVKLQQKVILTDDQAAKVEVILSNYIKDLTDGKNLGQILKKAELDISSILNEKQKAKYNIIEKDFFAEVNQRVLKKF